MDDEQIEAELFGPITSGIFNIDWLRERDTGIWRTPAPKEIERDRLRSQYLRLSNSTDAAEFDQVYPMLWRLDSEPKSAQSAIIALLDTGCLVDHPLLADCIDETIDFTGEGIEDRIGHGTGCALRARVLPYGGRRPRLFIAKVFGADRRNVGQNLIRGIEWAVGYAEKTGLAVYIMIRLGLYNRRWGGLRSCGGTCDVCAAALKALENPLVMLDAAPGNRPGQVACPAAAGLGLRPKPDAATTRLPVDRFVSVAERDYPDAGIATHVIEGDGRYSFAADTVTLFPPALFYRTLSHPAQAAALDAMRRSLGEPFFAVRGSWRIARLGNRWERVPHWPSPADEPGSGCPFGYGYDQHGLFFSSPALPGFWIRGATTDDIHAQLPDAMRRYLAQHPELPEELRREAIGMAEAVGGRVTN